MPRSSSQTDDYPIPMGKRTFNAHERSSHWIDFCLFTPAIVC